MGGRTVRNLASVCGVMGCCGMLGAGGCTLPQKRAAFDTPDPAERTMAIAQAARERDPETVPELIEELDSADPAVRMMAIGALRRITGEDLGYDYASPRSERSEAVDRWVAWQRARGPAGARSEASGVDPDDVTAPALDNPVPAQREPIH